MFGPGFDSPRLHQIYPEQRARRCSLDVIGFGHSAGAVCVALTGGTLRGVKVRIERTGRRALVAFLGPGERAGIGTVSWFAGSNEAWLYTGQRCPIADWIITEPRELCVAGYGAWVVAAFAFTGLLFLFKRGPKGVTSAHEHHDRDHPSIDEPWRHL